MIDYDVICGLLGETSNEVLSKLGISASLSEPVGGRSYVKLPESGVAFVFDVSALPTRLIAAHFYANGYRGYMAFSGKIKGLRFPLNHSGVIAVLGEPDARGGGERSAVFDRPVPRWIRYVEGDRVSVQCQLNDDDGIDMVSLFIEQ